MQCFRIALGGSKLIPTLRFSDVLGNSKAVIMHLAELKLSHIKALPCSEPKQFKSLVIFQFKSVYNRKKCAAR